ncbi:hypothetical protein PMI38_03506, partial [Pseudomonas sp. GM84]
MELPTIIGKLSVLTDIRQPLSAN